MRVRSKTFLRLACLAIAAVAILSISAVAFGAKDQSSSASASAASGIGLVPAAAQKYYYAWQGFSTLLPDPYKNWTAPKAPWKLCYNESYLGNAWRQESLTEFTKLAKQLQAAGLAKKGSLNVTNSNQNVPQELSQLNTQVNQGCQVIVIDAGSPTGLCSGLKNAFEHNVLSIIEDSTVYCPYAINVTINTSYLSLQNAQTLVTQLGGKGNVVLIGGLPGISITKAENDAALSVFKKYPGIKVIGQVTGNWTPSVAKSAMLQFIATHPQPINGVWESGQMDVAAEQALQQSGRPLAKLGSQGGECPFFVFAKDNHLPPYTVAGGAKPAMYESLEVALRMLNGAKPVVSTLIYPEAQITPKNFDSYYNALVKEYGKITLQSSCFANPPGGQAVPNSFFDTYMKGGTKPSINLVG
jgi:ribose transport system substrate-binding protein